MHRVIQWGTGSTGKHAIRGIARNPDLELVGARVYDPKKVGEDAGLIADTGPLGVLATDDEQAVLDLDADCILWMGAPTMFMPGADIDAEIAGLCRMLSSGKNVISIVHSPFLHVATLPPNMRDPIEAACDKAGVSFHFSGIDPGFVSEVVALTMTGLCRRIDKLVVREVKDFSTYVNAQVLFDVMGFGKPPDAQAQNRYVMAMMSSYGSSLRQIAGGLGETITKIAPHIEVRTADEDFQIVAGSISAGTISALRYGFDAYIGDTVKLSMVRINRLNDKQAPDWPHGHGHMVKVTGDPSFEVNLQLATETGRDELADSTICAAMHAVNSIPAVCQAPPGIRTALDMAMVTGRHAMKSDDL